MDNTGQTRQNGAGDALSLEFWSIIHGKQAYQNENRRQMRVELLDQGQAGPISRAAAQTAKGQVTA